MVSPGLIVALSIAAYPPTVLCALVNATDTDGIY